MIIQFVKFKSGLSDEEALRIMRERMPEFAALPGLIQKYYSREETTGEFAGIYLWDSQESLDKFRQSELAKSIPIAYEAQGTPRIELLDVIDKLRE